MKHIVDEGLVTVEDAWDLWCRKNPAGELEPAKQKVLLQLEALASRSPLSTSDSQKYREPLLHTNRPCRRVL